MVLLVKILSIAIIVYGCMLFLRPTILKPIVEYVKEGNRIYIANGIKIVIGIILLLASAGAQIPWLIFVLGALTVLTGAASFFVKKEVVTGIIKWLEKAKNKQIQLIGIIALAIGVLLALGI